MVHKSFVIIRDKILLQEPSCLLLPCLLVGCHAYQFVTSHTSVLPCQPVESNYLNVLRRCRVEGGLQCAKKCLFVCLQIHVGSTNVRVGSTIFGARNYPPKTT